MQEAIINRAALIIGGLLLFSVGCRKDTTVYRISRSPDGRAEASIALYAVLPTLAEWLKLELKTSDYAQTIKASRVGVDHEVDGGLCFAEVGWSNDSTTVGAYVVICSGPEYPVWFAFDTRMRKSLPVESVKDMIRETIRINYSAEMKDLRIDPIEWAKTDSGRYAFQRRRYGADVDLHAISTDHIPSKPFRTP